MSLLYYTQRLLVKYIHVSNLLQAKQAYNILQDLGTYYPDFYSWYWNKVIPNLYLGKVNIIIMLIGVEIVGVSILKKSEDECKLCALRINNKYHNRGYALYLIDYSLKMLDNSAPLCSVSEELINSYSRIFINRYNFSITHVYKGIYQKNKLEYEFNGNSNLKIVTPY